MLYVALLRGINVGGNKKVKMKKLKVLFEELGLSDVKTYINSGNIIFRDQKHSNEELVSLLEKAIENEFGFEVNVLVCSYKSLKTIAKNLPDTWVNDAQMKCDVMFLWESVDTKEVLKELTIKPEIDDVKYVPSAILWRVDREFVTKSGLMKLVGTPLYKKMTIRNANTLRKLVALMDGME